MSVRSLLSLIRLQIIVFLYVTKVGTIHLYQESLRRNSKYYNKIIVTGNVTLKAEHMHRE